MDKEYFIVFSLSAHDPQISVFIINVLWIERSCYVPLLNNLIRSNIIIIVSAIHLKKANHLNLTVRTNWVCVCGFLCVEKNKFRKKWELRDFRSTVGLKCDGRVRDGAFTDRYTVHCHLADAVIMYKCSRNNKHVENLMRLKLENKE